MVKTEKTNSRAEITKWLADTSDLLNRTANNASAIEKAAVMLITAYKSGHKMVLFGNGGSAADAQHLAAELVGGLMNHSRPSLPALALTTDSSAVTAIGNDYDFESVFSRQVESMVRSGDVVIALSTSGNSPNVVKGAAAARKKGASVIGLTGEDGGQLKNRCDLTICVPSNITSHVQEAHIAIGHVLCLLVEKAMTDASTE